MFPKNRFKFIAVCILLTVLLFTLNGCKKQPQAYQGRGQTITLNYYKLFEKEDNLSPLFQKFQQLNPNIRVEYRNFTDPDRYFETILSELAEGRGPDIISVPSSWIAQNYKKIAAAPADLAPPQTVRDVFVNVVAKDNIFIDQDGVEKVFGLPMYVDTLALYYNDQLFEEFLPELGKPSTTWDQIIQNTQILTLPDESGNLIRSGLAIGTGTGITRSADILNLIMLQNEVELSKNSNFNFASNTKTTRSVNLYTNFNNLEGGYSSWQDKLGTELEKEIYAFATGKTAMIFGYSYLYQDILNTIELAKRNNDTAIDAKNVKITEAPQFAGAESSINLANYFSETVTRNSKHPIEAWKLVTFLTNPENLETYYKKNFRPTSRRELISTQKQNPIFFPFANQVGTAVSINFPDSFEATEIFQAALDKIVLENENPQRAILEAQQQLNNTISNEGLFPPSRNKLKN